MHEHFRIISAVINLILGTIIAFTMQQGYRTFRFPYLRHLLNHILLFNGCIFLLLAGKYFELNLMVSWTQKQIGHYQDTAIITALLLFGGMIFQLHKISRSFRPDEKLPVYRWFLLVGLTVTLTTFPIRHFFLKGLYPEWLETVFGMGVGCLLITEIALQIGMIRYGRKKGENAKLSLSLGWLFLSRYFFITSLFLIIGLFSGWTIPDFIAPYAAFFILIYLNAVPFIWLKRIFTPYATSLGNLIDKGDTMEAFFRKNNISKREQEIIRLLLDGKSNKQIEETLFISYHTVKNHLYNIYKKLRIKNRYELVHQVTRFQHQR